MPKILAIGNINDALMSLKVFINEAFPGSIVFTANNGAKGIELAIANDPDVILLDIVPGIDGFEVCRQLKHDERVSDIPVVFLTALNGDKESRIKALEVGAEGFLSIPIDETELTAQIRAMVKIKVSNEQRSDEKESLKKMVEERTIALQNELNERTKAEELLRESEYFFKESQRAAFIGSYKFDIIADFWTSSEVLEQIFGIDKNFNRNLQAWIDIVHPDDRNMMVKYFGEEVVSKRKPFNKEYRIIRKSDGETRWVHGLGQLNFDDQDNIVSMIGTIQDITGRKYVEESLRETNEFNNSLLKIIPFGMSIVGEEGNILFQSEGFEKVFGKNVIGCKCWNLYRDDKVQCVKCPLKKGIKLGESQIYESAGVLGGRVFEISHTGMMFQGKKAILEIFQDITERKRAEEKLQEVNHRFSELVASTDGIVWEADAKTFTFSFVSKNAERILGYEIEDWLQPGFWANHIFEDDKNTTVQFCVDQTNQGNNHDFEYRFHTKDGRTVWLADFVKVIEERGKPRWLHGLMVDITERKQAEESMRTTKKLLEQTFDQSPVPMVLVSMPDMVIRIVNPACLSFLGIEDEPSVINTRLIDLKPTWQDFDLTGRTGKLEDLPLAQSLIGKKTENDERYILRKDGTIRYEVVNSFPIFDDEGQIIAGHLIMLDITERKQVLEELQKSYDMLNKLTAQVPGVVYQYRLYPDGRSAFPFSSPGMYDIYEVTPEEVREDASPVFSRIHPDDYNDIVLAITESARTQTLYHSEFRVILPKQGLRWRLCDAQPELLEDGSTLWYGIISDITERKLAEQRLTESQQLFQGLFNASPDSILLIDPHDPATPWLIIDCNEAACKMNGYLREEMIGQSIDLLHPKTVTREDHDFNLKNIRNKGILRLEADHRHKKGYLFPIEVSTSVVNIGGRELVLGIDRDISDRKKAESDLRESEVQYRNLANSGIALIWTTGADKLCNYVNEPWLRFTGRTFEQELGNGWAKGVHPDDLIACVQSYNAAFEKREAFEMEYRLRHASGEYRWVQDMGTPNYNHDGEFVGYIGYCFDINDRKKIEMELILAKENAEESDRLKSAFLANMSHEIRTPLNSIIGFSELMTNPNFDADQQSEFAKIILNSGNSLLSIISDIMDFSKIEAGQIKVNKLPFVTHKLISEIQKEYSIVAREKGVELKIDPLNPKEEIWITSDENRVRQVLINLVGNAIKFTKEGYVELGFKAIGDCVQFHVCDSGIGIPEEYHDKIFERFRQVESAISRTYGGNGLGLAISKSLVEIMGGEIWMESAQSKGSTFYFTIPK